MDRLRVNRKSIVVVSTMVSSLLATEMPDADVLVFNSLMSLLEYTETGCIRADTLYMSEEILGQTPVKFLTLLADQLQHTPTLRIGKMELLVAPGGNLKELTNTVANDANKKATAEEERLDWRVVDAPQQRDHFVAYIKGELREEDITVQGKNVYIERRSIYEAREARKRTLVGKYVNQEEELAEVPVEECPTISTTVSTVSCRMYTIASKQKCAERLTLSLLLCQYLAYSGRVIIVEKDFKYLSLAEAIAYAELDVLRITVEELLSDTEAALTKIRYCQQHIIAVVAEHSSDTYDYDFICNLLYYNLYRDIEFFVQMRDYKELSNSSVYIAVLPCNVSLLAEEVQHLPERYDEHATFVGVNTSKLEPLYMLDSEALSNIVAELLSFKEVKPIQILNTKSLKLGGDAYDLRGLLT